MVFWFSKTSLKMAELKLLIVWQIVDVSPAAMNYKKKLFALVSDTKNNFFSHMIHGFCYAIS